MGDNINRGELVRLLYAEKAKYRSLHCGQMCRGIDRAIRIACRLEPNPRRNTQREGGVNMEKAIYCPWCGCKMALDNSHTQFCCEHCGSRGPDCNCATEAYAETTKRYRPPLKPLEWEDVIADDAYLERYGDEYVDVALNIAAMSTDGIPGFDDCVYYDTHGDDDVKLMRSDYGKTWRCWAHRPTPEERAAVPWEKSPEEGDEGEWKQ